MIHPQSQWPPALQREHILATLEPVPSGVRPGTAEYERVLAHWRGLAKKDRPPEARGRIVEMVRAFAAKHKAAGRV